MFETIKRSWKLTKITLEVIKKDKELIVFPILSGIFSTLFFITMLFPIVLLPLLNGTRSPFSGAINLLIIFSIYLGLAVISTFFSVCIVYTTKKRFEGGNATFMESIRFAFSRFFLILSWGLVSAVIGILLRVIDYVARRLGGIGELILRITTSILGAAWSLVTIFVVPVMVYHDYGPFNAIKTSAAAFRKTWGENIVQAIGFGAVEALFFIFGIFIAIVMMIIASSYGSILLLAIIAVAVVAYFIAIFTFFSLLNTIYSTALYIYSEKGQIPRGFDEETVKKSFSGKEK